MTPEQVLILLLLALVVVLAFAWWLATTRGSRESRARVGRAALGESAAERLLERRGYRVVARQVPSETWMTVDGEPFAVHVRADLLVEQGSDRFVAEVKTGAVAPDPTWPATRRQLLEYGRAFPDHRLLLVDPERGVISEIGFP